jgi:alkylated DNA repair dioxygenase AlkB
MEDLAVQYVPRFVEDPDGLLEALRASTAWDTRMKARLTASFGVAYNYSRLAYADAHFPPRLLELKARIEPLVGHPFTSCLANLYEDGSRTMGWHSDSEPEIHAKSSIAIVSLGAAWALEFRPKGEAYASRSLLLEPGSLLVMAASVQERWQHRLPRIKGAAARMSLTFRQIVRITSP